MKARSAAQIIKAIGCDNLSLYRGEGYWYFVYDSGGDLYADRSVYVMYLNSWPLEEWVKEGRALVEEMEGPR